MLSLEIKNLPNNPGVYQYFDANSRLLYVGKAKILKNRVKSYFIFTPKLSPSPRLSPRIAKMISETTHIEYIITPTEADALILENSFIKQLKPKYNILLRDDKTYPYIYIDLSQNFPRFDITRKIIKGDKIRYFGPFFSGCKELLDAIYLNHKLIQKQNCLKNKKSCMFYQIKRCLAPCESKISKQEYSKIVNQAIKSLQNPNILIPRLQELMQTYAKNLNFEQAAKVRDQINTISLLDTKIEVDIAKLENFEMFAIASHHDIYCVVRFSINSGKISGVKSEIIKSREISSNEKNEIYKQFILDSFSIDTPFTSTKLYTLDEFDDSKLVSEILTSRHGKKFSIQTPKIGEKLRIANIARQNAELSIQRHLSNNNESFYYEFAKYFSLSHVPFSVECFDNSHLFGEASVAAMIRYENGEFIKEKYRHMHLDSKNDYGQMRESLSMRAMRFDKLNPPDLWVIDGGKALLDLAHDIIKSSGANIDVIAISKEKINALAHRAKGSAKDKIYTLNATFSLDTNDKKLQFLQKLRDEAHRFAISFHQKTRRKNDMQSSKLKSLGISDASIAKLVKFYGNFDKIHQASYDEIAKLTNKSVADKLFKDKN